MRLTIGLLFFVGLFAATPCLAMLTGNQLVSAKAATAFLTTEQRSGTAFCIKSDGYFATNYQVVAGAKDLTLVLNPGSPQQQEYTAQLVNFDEQLDLAVVKIEAQQALTVLPLLAGSTLADTMPVTTVGYPLGDSLATAHQAYPSPTVTMGRITALRKQGSTVERIQVDANINPGHAGAPLLNDNGEVIGIVEASVPGTGIHFALPTSQLRSLINKPKRATLSPGEITPVQAGILQTFSITIEPFNRNATISSVEVQWPSPNKTLRSLNAVKIGDWEYQINVVPLPGGAVESTTLNFTVVVKQGTAVFKYPGMLSITKPFVQNRPDTTQIHMPQNRRALALASTVESWVAGYNGRYLILKLKGISKLFIVDVSQERIIKEIPLPSDNVRFAAGASTLHIALCDTGVLQRWSLVTLSRERTVPLPNGDIPRLMLMSPYAESPLFVINSLCKVSFFDAQNYQALSCPDPGRLIITSTICNVTSNGSLFVVSDNNYTYCFNVSQQQVAMRSVYKTELSGPAVCDPAGKLFLTYGGVYSLEEKPREIRKQRGWPYLALPNGFYVAGVHDEQNTQLQYFELRSLANPTLAMSFSDVTELDAMKERLIYENSTMANFLHYYPDGGSLVYVSGDEPQLVFYTFSVPSQ